MNEGEPGSYGWMEYRRMILSNLRELNEKCDNMADALVQIRVEVAGLKAKAGVWGALGGLIFGGLLSWLMGKK